MSFLGWQPFSLREQKFYPIFPLCCCKRVPRGVSKWKKILFLRGKDRGKEEKEEEELEGKLGCWEWLRIEWVNEWMNECKPKKKEEKSGGGPGERTSRKSEQAPIIQTNDFANVFISSKLVLTLQLHRPLIMKLFRFCFCLGKKKKKRKLEFSPLKPFQPPSLPFPPKTSLPQTPPPLHFLRNR